MDVEDEIAGELLRAARKRLALSQLEAAGRMQVSMVTYQRWEQGKADPQPYNQRKIREFVKDALLDDKAPAHLEQEASSNQGASVQDTEVPEAEENDPSVTAVEACVSISTPQDVPDAIQTFIASHMSTHLWDLAHMSHPTCNEKRRRIRQAIKEFDKMNTTNKNYHITRRDALYALASLPMITLGLSRSGGSPLEPSQYGTAVAHCAASLEACWELGKSNDAGDVRLAFESASQYLPQLEMIAKHSAQYRKEALDLATRYALVKTYLGWECVGSGAVIQYARNALALSKQTGDISLQLSAYSKLAWSYLHDQKYTLALVTAQEAEAQMQDYIKRSDAQPLHPCISGGTYSILALMQARNGRSPDEALGKATERDPGNEAYAFMDFKRSNLLLETGRTYYYAGNQSKAMELFEQRVDPLTFAPRIPQSESGRLEAINLMALSSLKTPEREMEKTLHFWTAAIKGAKAFQSEDRFNEAVTTYAFMEFVWPGEQRITDLRDLIVHW